MMLKELYYILESNGTNALIMNNLGRESELEFTVYISGH